jgi:hypothetical protein
LGAIETLRKHLGREKGTPAACKKKNKVAGCLADLESAKRKRKD